MEYKDSIEYLKTKIDKNGDLKCIRPFIEFEKKYPSHIILDGGFNLEELEAIVAYMKGIE